MKIKFGMGNVQSKQLTTKLFNNSHRINISIVDKKKIDVSKSKTALLANFVHSLDAANVHLVSEELLKLINDMYKNEFNNMNNKQEYLEYLSNYLMDNNDKMKMIDLTFDMRDEEQNGVTQKLLSYENELYHLMNRSSLNLYNYHFKFLTDKESIILLNSYVNTIPLYTIHDCFASDAKNMVTLKKIVNLIFAKMYFDYPYLVNVHENILKQIASYTDVYMLKDNINNENKNITNINNFIKVDGLNLFNLSKENRDLYVHISHTNVKDKEMKFIKIPHFPANIKSNIEQYQKIFRDKVPFSKYLIS